LAGNWPRCRLFREGLSRGLIESTGFMPLLQQHTETLTDDDLAVRASRRQFAADQRNARLRRQHIDASLLHHVRDGAAGGHTDSPPGRPVDGDAARGWT